jgi:predicted nuclease of predicted toxin-antitoxin system
MKFLIDAQLPRRLALRLHALGHDALHTLDLPLANRTPDDAINALSLLAHRIVITKDADFVNSFLLSRKPWKLLLIATGNHQPGSGNPVFPASRYDAGILGQLRFRRTGSDDPHPSPIKLQERVNP